MGIQDWLSTRVAAIVVKSKAIAGSDFGLDNWDVIAQALCQKSVRVLALKDSSAEFRDSLQKLMQFTQLSGVCGSEPSFFVLGPVAKVADDERFFWTAHPTMTRPIHGRPLGR